MLWTDDGVKASVTDLVEALECSSLEALLPLISRLVSVVERVRTEMYTLSCLQNGCSLAKLAPQAHFNGIRNDSTDYFCSYYSDRLHASGRWPNGRRRR